MPIYEYDCQECGRAFEDITSYEDRNITCECGADLTPLPSKAYFRSESMYVNDPDTGHRLSRNDSKESPWAGAGAGVEAQQRAEAEDRARFTKRQTKIQVDHGTKTNVGAIH
jgi:putative FmdB family regulatory protein